MIPSRITTVPALGLASSYPKKYKPKQRHLTDVFGEGNLIVPDMYEALQKLDKLVRLQKGTLHVIELFRSWKTQSEAREKYLSGKKKDFVAKPGGSFHNAGRAVDIKIEELNFEDTDRDEWLQLLWDLAKPLGFYPIISIPDIDASESWHFDFPGDDWEMAYDLLQYGEAAKCCVLDIGKWNPNENEEKVRKMFIQAQLIRLEFYEVGKIDGAFGPKTNKVLEFCGVADFDTKMMADTLSRR